MTEIPAGLVLAHLYGLRASLDAVIGTLEHVAVGGPPDPGTCEHPDNARRDVTTAGGPRRFLCLLCQQEVLGIA
jgi:hypothetical protein